MNGEPTGEPPVEATAGGVASPTTPDATSTAAAHRLRNGVAVAALVVGIVATAYGIIPLLFLLAWLLGPIAIVLGLVGWYRVRRNPARPGRAAAIAGTILGCSAIVLGLAGVVIIDRTLTAVSDRIEDVLGTDDPAEDVEVSVDECQRQDADTAMASGTIRSTADEARDLTVQVEVKAGDVVAGVFTTVVFDLEPNNPVAWQGTGVAIDLEGRLSCSAEALELD